MRGGVNFYLYVANNPLRYVDPFGLEYTVAKIDTPLGTIYVDRTTMDAIFDASPSRVLGWTGRVLQENGFKSLGKGVSTVGRICDTGGNGKIIGAVAGGASGARLGSFAGPFGAVVGGIIGSAVGGSYGSGFDSSDAGNLY